MKTNQLSFWARIRGIAGIVSFGIAVTASASHPPTAGDNSAQVGVWQETLPGKVVYHYRVTNNEPNSTIPRFAVGYDHWHGLPMLKKDPPGYGYPPENPPGGSSRICAPDGWRGKIVYTEEAADFNIEWAAKKRKHHLPAGQSLSGFAIEVSAHGADDSYRNSFFDVIFNGGRYLHSSTHIVADTPPAPGTAAPLKNCIDPYLKKKKDKAGSDHDDDEDEDDDKAQDRSVQR